jgi:hypothetical protein
VLVIADKTAKPDWVAADLLAQAEHGHGSQAILVTDSEKILTGVEKAVERQTKLSKRPAELAKALKNTKLILVEDMQEAIRIANEYASEHVSIATDAPGEIALQLRHLGRDLPRWHLARGRRRLPRRAKPRASDGWCRPFLCRSHGRSVPAPHQHRDV